LGIDRLQELRRNIESHNLKACLISQPENVRYLSGFNGSAGWLLISSNKALLAVDFRYTEQAKNESPEFEILHIQGDILNWFPQIVTELNYKTIGFEADVISFSLYKRICDEFKNRDIKVTLFPTNNLVESLRTIKDKNEQEYVISATNLADSAIDYAKSVIAPGLTENEIAWEIEKYLRSNGSETLPFDVIVASGPNAALPHAKSSKRVIQLSEPVLIDIGARINGYCSDLSRTFCCGKADNKFSEVYDIVLGAQLSALAMIESGMSGDEADKLARTIIDQAGYADSFGHGLGHGIGLSIHELPRIGPLSSDILCNGMIFTVEPGIYITGWGGVRIEDTVMMQNGKITNFSKADKMAII